MSFRVQQREADGITIFDIDGHLVLGPDLETLQDSVTQNIERGNVREIFNLKQVPFIDSSALGLLVLLHQNVKSAGGALKLLHLSKRHLELMILTKLAGVFEIFDNEQDAINSFYPEREVTRFDILEFVKSHENDGGAITEDSSEKP